MLSHLVSARLASFLEAILASIIIASVLGGFSIPVDAQAGFAPQVFTAIASAKTQKLSDLPSAAFAPQVQGTEKDVPNREVGDRPLNFQKTPTFSADTVLQPLAPTAQMPAAIQAFEGVTNLSAVLPPDPNGDVGFDPASGKKYYVQWVNLNYAVWDVTGTPTRILGPLNGESIWLPLSNICSANGEGDPVVLFDSLSDRWLLSQFAFQLSSTGNPTNPPYYQCVAISQTGDPTGAYYLYAFAYPSNLFGDYPKFGVWSDGYYMTANQFSSSTWAGAGALAFERSKMLVGDPSAQMVYFNLANANSNFGGMLPADISGATAPPPGAPEVFAEVDSSAVFGTSDALRLWNFKVNWTNPAQSTFGLSSQPNQTLAVAPFNLLPCVTSNSRYCIPQAGTGARLDAVADRMMYRLSYRNFGNHQTLLANHTVWADGTDRAGIRWYELRSTGGAWSIYQQSTYAPADGNYRWMGSLAMDNQGNLALGYSVSGASIYPSIAYAGRLTGDPAGQLTQGEAIVVNGTGAQLSSAARWGDYSTMSVDPQDGCTFWYTQEYVPVTSSSGWSTKIASFRFPQCSNNLGSGNSSGTVVDGIPSGHAWPLYARLDLTSSSGTVTSFSDPVTGAYQVTLNPSTAYSLKVTPQMAGYASQTISIPAGSGVPSTISLLALPGVCPAGYTAQAGACNLVRGGLVVGLVKDQNTGLGVNGASLAAGTNATVSFASGDPAEGDGFYILFAGSGSVSVSATSTGYTTQKKTLSLASNSSIVRQDFTLPAGRLSTTQSEIQAQLAPGKSGTVSLNLSNTGSVAINYSLTMSPASPGWVSATTLSGKIVAGATQTISLTLNSTGLSVGLHNAVLSISTDTPYGTMNLPVNLVVGGVVFLPLVGK